MENLMRRLFSMPNGASLQHNTKCTSILMFSLCFEKCNKKMIWILLFSYFKVYVESGLCMVIQGLCNDMFISPRCVQQAVTVPLAHMK